MPHIGRDPPCGGPQLLSRLLYFVFEQCTFVEGAKDLNNVHLQKVQVNICFLCTDFALTCVSSKVFRVDSFFESVASSLRVVGDLCGTFDMNSALGSVVPLAMFKVEASSLRVVGCRV